MPLSSRQDQTDAPSDASNRAINKVCGWVDNSSHFVVRPCGEGLEPVRIRNR
jgi:hypothetical protein